MDFLTRAIATGLFSGYAPVGPGTAGSALAALIIWFIMPEQAQPYLVITLILLPVSIWASGRAEKQFGHDGGQIVIDEIIGMLVTMALIPLTLTSLAIGFVCFRIMDITKPYPVNQIQNLPGGWGVVADDVLAAVYANLLTQGILLLL